MCIAAACAAGNAPTCNYTTSSSNNKPNLCEGKGGKDRVVPMGGGAHWFRHAMATHMLENGVAIRFIQAILSHSDLKFTPIYTLVSIEKLREIHRATHRLVS